jgi:hypothetical protein
VFSESIGTLFKAVVQHLIGTEIEEGVGHTFLGEKSLYSPYGPAQKSRAVPQKILGTFFKVLAHFSRHFFLLGFPYSLGRILGTNFETVRTTLIVGTTVQLYGFLVQKSRSKATGMSR